MEVTIRDREGKVKGAMSEVKSIVEDFRMQAIGGMMAAWELWEKAMVPSLLSGAGTWTGITSTEIESLDKMQDFFWRVMLRVPESCPSLARQVTSAKTNQSTEPGHSGKTDFGRAENKQMAWTACGGV